MAETPHPTAHAFILAGGRGTRFWPLSRREHPKQLLDFTGEGSLLALTAERVAPLVPRARQWIITNADLRSAVTEAAEGLPEAQVIGEPEGRNTAPAVALAAAVLEAQAGDVPFLVLPSDHLISPGDRFRRTLDQALRAAASEDVLLTFGIEPTRPETGYGYIESGEWLAGVEGVRRVAAFREKPELEVARDYLERGGYFWNSGMFAWRTSVVLAGLEEVQPELVASMRRVAASGAPGTSAFESALQEAYESAPRISIDFALMEKAPNVGVVPADFVWNDVGHWLAMRDLWSADASENAAMGTVVPVDSHRNVVYGPDRVTALVGVDDLVVVHTEDATLVCSTERAQDVRRVLDRLKEKGLNRYL
jgi:mannose-1-phosphate guanylyltransferase